MDRIEGEKIIKALYKLDLLAIEGYITFVESISTTGWEMVLKLLEGSEDIYGYRDYGWSSNVVLFEGEVEV